MTCKNCKNNLASDFEFCNQCGAKVVKDRISLKLLIADLLSRVLGWDNKLFRTIKKLVTKPEDLFSDYISGVRKRYVNPFTFFAIGATTILLIFNQFTESYLSITNSNITEQFEEVSTINPTISNVEKPTLSKKAQARVDLKNTQVELNSQVQRFMLKYFNFISFLMLPFYALIAWLVYGKPYNFGEHLIINAYIQGFTFFINAIIFLISMVINPQLYLFGSLTTIIFYTYAYSRFYKLSIGKTLLRLLKFIGIMCVFSIAIILLIIAITLIIKALS